MDPAEIDLIQQRVVPTRHALRHAVRLMTRDVPDRRYVDILRELYRRVGLAAEARVVVDSSKMPGDALLVRQIGDVRAVAVHVVRDPRGVVLSQARRRSRYGQGRSAHLLMGRLALGWLGRNLVSERVVRRFGREGVRIRYEDAVADPHRLNEAVAKVARRPAVPPPVDELGRFILPAGHGASAIDGAWRRAEEGVVDERVWMHELSRLDQRLVGAICWPLMRRYGYRTFARVRRGA